MPPVKIDEKRLIQEGGGWSAEELTVGHNWIGGVSRNLWDGEYWHPSHRLMNPGQPDQDMKT